jgi:uncharacterized protein (DUF2225 family)
MDKNLEKIIETFKETFNLNEKDIEEIKKQVSYLDYSFFDILQNYKEEKMRLSSLIIYFGYIFGTLLDDEKSLEIFLSILEAVYTVKKIKEKMS